MPSLTRAQNQKVARLHAEEEALKTKYNGSSAKLGTFAEVLMLDSIDETIAWLKKIKKFNGKYNKAVSEAYLRASNYPRSQRSQGTRAQRNPVD